jgi:hypothetical protein
MNYLSLTAITDIFCLRLRLLNLRYKTFDRIIFSITLSMRSQTSLCDPEGKIIGKMGMLPFDYLRLDRRSRIRAFVSGSSGVRKYLWETAPFLIEHNIRIRVDVYVLLLLFGMLDIFLR